jgi:adenylate cyclase
MLAAFVIAGDGSIACRDAFPAVLSVEHAMSNLVGRCEAEFGVTLNFMLCLHAGLAAIGEIGDELSPRYTAAGPAVDTAQRMRAAAVRKDARVLVSVDVLERAGASPAAFAGLDIEAVDEVASPEAVAVDSLNRVVSLFLAGSAAPTVRSLVIPGSA